MISTKELITNLKEVRKERKLSYDNILRLMEQNGYYLSKSTLSRIFAEGSEYTGFCYETTLRPLALTLLDGEIIDNSTSESKENESKNDEQLYLEHYVRFLEEQISYNNKQIDMLLNMLLDNNHLNSSYIRMAKPSVMPEI